LAEAAIDRAGDPLLDARAPTSYDFECRLEDMRRSVAIVLLLSALMVTSTRTAISLAADAKPYFLVASPEMRDPVFRNSVIMMVPTSQAPLIAGVIINEPTGTTAQEVFPHFPALKDDPSSAYFGGPVDNGQPILALRTSHPPANTTQIVDDVYVSTDADTIGQILRDQARPDHLRIFLGRAQWAKDQLHYEIMEGAWYVMPADADQIFSADPAHLWHKLAERGQLQETGFIMPFAHAPQ
jgi:putative transcriptional regulator